MTELKRCVIATRESPLAMWQALHVQALLRNRYPEMDVQILGMTTKGDQILDKTLSKIGGKGLFVKELEAAMLEGQADLAVHSLKDVPIAFVSPKYARLEDMPAGARVGTASLRRELMLRSEFPHLTVLPIRGNVGTRLSKLDNGDFDALVMAGAGLKRLKLEDRIRELLPVETSLPAPGQGALGVEVRADRKDLLELLAFINDEDIRCATGAERAVSRALGGSCQVPLAAHGIVENGELWLRAHVGDHRDGRKICAQARGKAADFETVAAEVVANLKAQGAEALLAEVLAATAK